MKCKALFELEQHRVGARRQCAPDFCVMQIARVTVNFPMGINGNTCVAVSDICTGDPRMKPTTPN